MKQAATLPRRTPGGQLPAGAMDPPTHYVGRAAVPTQERTWSDDSQTLVRLRDSPWDV